MIARDYLLFAAMILAVNVTAAPMAVPAADGALVEPLPLAARTNNGVGNRHPVCWMF